MKRPTETLEEPNIGAGWSPDVNLYELTSG
jgi:hypothetical protein